MLNYINSIQSIVHAWIDAWYFIHNFKGKRKYEKTNSSSNAIQVKANLYEQLSDHFNFRKQNYCSDTRYVM